MMKRAFETLATRSDAELERGLRGLLDDGARIEARIVAHLAQVEARRLHLRAGYPSMFQYCLEHLGLSENEAFHRIVAARTAARFPVVFELLETREIHLSAVCLLRRHLTHHNHGELLAEACGKSKRQVEELLARRFPGSVDARARERGFKPISEDCFRLELYVTKAQKEKLELARDLVSHANPSGDWGVVIERAVDALAEKVQARRFGKLTDGRPGQVCRHERLTDAARVRGVPSGASQERPGAPESRPATEDQRGGSELKVTKAGPPAGARAARNANGGRRHIPNPVRGLVAERDELSCTFTSETGRRCGARGFLQFDHRHPWALGGSETPANLRILCAAHNRLLAEQEFGATAAHPWLGTEEQVGAETGGCGRETEQATQSRSVAAESPLCPGKVPKSAA